MGNVEVWIESHTSKDGTIPASLATQVMSFFVYILLYEFIVIL